MSSRSHAFTSLFYFEFLIFYRFYYSYYSTICNLYQEDIVNLMLTKYISTPSFPVGTTHPGGGSRCTKTDRKSYDLCPFFFIVYPIRAVCRSLHQRTCHSFCVGEHTQKAGIRSAHLPSENHPLPTLRLPHKALEKVATESAFFANRSYVFTFYQYKLPELTMGCASRLPQRTTRRLETIAAFLSSSRTTVSF